jgi:two-component system C4-dicarboxylate transport response regulator DctD
MSYSGPILIVDDDPRNISRIEQALATIDCETDSAGDGEQALVAMSRLSGSHGFPGIVITDMKMPVMGGLEFLERAQAIDSDLPVILISAYGEVASAVQAMKNGAYDFIERPFETENLRTMIMRALEKRTLVMENRRLKAELANRPGMAARIIGNSSAIQTLRDEIANIASTDASVLIYGETGTGKEVAARCLHEFSGRKRSRFVAINCGALAENLIESELFGHEPGAFTDAKRQRIGLVEYAKGGTLFLDEIESMPLNLQVKLLRMLQERTISRLGSNEEVKVDIRVIAATKIDLMEAAERNEFREDVFYRLNVAELHIPPLNERREDIPLLFEHFAQELAARHQREVPVLSREDIQFLMAHDWRGNVRELRNIAERFVLHIGPRSGGLAPVMEGDGGKPQTLPTQMDTVEGTLVRTALADNSGNIQATADALGIPRRTLNEKMRKHGLDRNDFR